MEQRISEELDRISLALVDNRNITPRQYEQLYAAQQALHWASDPNSAKSPYETIMQNLVHPPSLDIPASSVDYQAVHHPPLS
jgi:hypothetical protein